MAGLNIRKADACDEQRRFDKGHAEILKYGGETAAGRYTFEPGWRWSKDMAARIGTPTCQTAHLGYCVSGRMKIQMDDGQSAEVGPGDFMQIEPGHDAWVLGNEPCVMLDFAGAAHYAERFARPAKQPEAAQPSVH